MRGCGGRRRTDQRAACEGRVVPPAVLGDFLAAADEHIGTAALAVTVPVTGFAPAAKDLYRLVVILSRYCADLAPCDEVEASGRSDLHAWERAIIDAGAALDIAVDCLRRGVEEAAREQPGPAPGPSRHLAAAATELTAGRDLLHTHRVTDPAGLTRSRSEWAPVLTSLPVLRALANEIGRWSWQLAPFAALLASSGTWHGPPGGHDPDVLLTAAWSSSGRARGWRPPAQPCARRWILIRCERRIRNCCMRSRPRRCPSDSVQVPSRNRLPACATGSLSVPPGCATRCETASNGPGGPPASRRADGSGWPRRQR